MAVILLSSTEEKKSIYPDEIEQIIKERKENNRIKFLSQHLIDYGSFVKNKLKDGISVYHIADDSEYITSDNPVIIRPYVEPTEEFLAENYSSQEINPFDKKNTIHVPIDSKTLLTILPNLDDYPDLKIRRLDKTKFDTLMYNYDVERYSEKWILGESPNISNHIKDQFDFAISTPENEAILNAYKEKTLELHKLYNLIRIHGLRNGKVVEKANYMKTLKSIQDDSNFLSVFKSIEEANRKNEQ